MRAETAGRQAQNPSQPIAVDFAGAPVARDNASALICPADGIAGNTTRTSASLSAALAPGAAIPSRAS